MLPASRSAPETCHNASEHHSRADKLHRVRRTDRAHGEMIADANQHDVDLVVIGNARDVGKKSGIAGVINRRSVANANDKPCRHAGGDCRRIFIFLHSRPVPRRNKASRHLGIQ